MSAPHNKMVIAGTLPGGEVWTINPCFALNDGSAISSFADLQVWAAAVRTYLAGGSFSTSLKSALSNVANITTVTAQYYDASGALIQAAQASGAAISGSGTPNKTLRDAIVLSLLTGRPGRSYRGRLYWPGLMMALDPATIRIPGATTALLATGAAAMLNAIKLAVPAPYVANPVVVSQTKSVATPITTVQVGDGMDTQRRRTDSWVEAYATAPI